MIKTKVTPKTAKKDKYDFSSKNPSAVITPDEEVYFDECMSRKNKTRPANEITFKEAVQSVDMERLFPL